MNLVLLWLALLIERVFGYPDFVFRLIGHPVKWMGHLIASCDAKLNHDSQSDGSRRARGIATLLLLLVVTAGCAFALQWLLGNGAGLLIAALIGSSLLAQRSLETHVVAVATALESSGVEAGRTAVSQIVGRDPQSLDEAAVCRAAIESLAENFSDGVVAPAFWLGACGLAGGAAYKAINTADSMIGHKTARHQAFGWAAARLDDLVNLPASRLSALLIVCAAATVKTASATNAWRCMWRDAHHHKSPNAGWPEAAIAGALGLALAGPRTYGGVLVDDVFMGESGRRDATAADIRRAVQLYRRADALLIALAAILAGAFLLAA